MRYRKLSPEPNEGAEKQLQRYLWAEDFYLLIYRFVRSKGGKKPNSQMAISVILFLYDKFKSSHHSFNNNKNLLTDRKSQINKRSKL